MNSNIPKPGYLRAVRREMVLKIVIAGTCLTLSAACGRVDFEDVDWRDSAGNIGQGNADSNAMDAGVADAGSVDNLLYVGPVVRVPIAAPDGTRFIDQASNELGVQGNWYFYNDNVSTTNLSNSINGFFYISGEVAPGALDEYMYIGMGMGLCFAPEGNYYPIGTCPFAPNLSARIVGVAFDVNGTSPDSGALELMFISTSTGASLHWRIPSAGYYEVLFSDMNLRAGAASFSIGELDRMQFQLGNQTADVVPYDFFVGNMAILIRP